MIVKRLITDPFTCEKLWKTCIPACSIADLWEFRSCFQRHFGNRPCFTLLEDGRGIAGMLPLSHIDHMQMKSFYPGETWNNRSWLERTQIYVREPYVYEDLLSSCSERTFLRYMEAGVDMPADQLELDEIGYVLYPALLNYDMENFRQRFSAKKFKTIMKTVNNVMESGGSFHVNRLSDFNLLVKMSLSKFGESSYLSDPRFRESFRDIMHYLYDRGWLRMISLELNGKTAAVDLGAVYRGTYTVFLGGVFSDFPGIAKVMNMYHVDYALKNRMFKLDFLCGDFHWKKLWHLDPEPLYRLVSPDLEERPGIVRDSLNVFQTVNYKKEDVLQECRNLH